MSDAAQPTAAEVRAAVEALKAALDSHLAAIERREEVGDDQLAEADTAVGAAFDALAAAGEAYDELLYAVYDEVTPFEIPSGETVPAYTGPPVPGALSVLTRRDYTLVEPQRLLAQAQRITQHDPDLADEEEDDSDTAEPGSGMHTALSVVFGEYDPDEIAARHREFGLEKGDSTLWVLAGEEPPEPGEWLAAPFDDADPERVVCRFDTSPALEETSPEGR